MSDEAVKKPSQSLTEEKVKDLESGIWPYPPPRIEFTGVYTSDKTRRWTPPPSLREQILNSRDPMLRFHRKLIEIMGLKADSQIRDLLEKTSADTAEKVVFIFEKTGRILEEFLFTDLTYEQIMMLDAIVKYYRDLEDPLVQKCLSQLKNAYALEHTVNIDGKRYKAKLYAFIDGYPLRLEYFADKFNRPIIGCGYRGWLCFVEAEKRLENEFEKLKTLSLEDALLKFKEIERSKEILDRYKKEIVEFRIENFIRFPLKYTKRNGILGKHLYVNKISRQLSSCDFCGKAHYYVLIAEVG